MTFSFIFLLDINQAFFVRFGRNSFPPKWLNSFPKRWNSFPKQQNSFPRTQRVTFFGNFHRFLYHLHQTLTQNVQKSHNIGQILSQKGWNSFPEHQNFFQKVKTHFQNAKTHFQNAKTHFPKGQNSFPRDFTRVPLAGLRTKKSLCSTYIPHKSAPRTTNPHTHTFLIRVVLHNLTKMNLVGMDPRKRKFVKGHFKCLKRPFSHFSLKLSSLDPCI